MALLGRATLFSPENTWPAGAEAGPGDFEDFVRSRSGSLLRSAYVLTGDQHLAEDLVQGALVKLYRRWGSVHRHGNPDAYVRKAMYHLQVSVWRRGRVAESFPATMPEPGRDDHASATATRLALRQALLGLPPRQRAVLVLRFLEDRSEADTAEILDCSVGNVKSQASRALARLREIAPELHDIDPVKGGIQ
jgi:RNA polymerase sigma-70 factor (sigma-E family)